MGVSGCSRARLTLGSQYPAVGPIYIYVYIYIHIDLYEFRPVAFTYLEP